MTVQESEKAFLDELVAHGLLIPVGVPGIYGRGGQFEDIISRFDALITRTGGEDGAEVMRFPPVISRKIFEQSGYLKSFPHLAGTVFSFEGTQAGHQKLLGQLERGEAWADSQSMTDVVLTPAACYPVYPTIAARGPLPENGHLIDVYSYCFRHEPSGDPARMQMFRMREYIRIADGATVRAFRGKWLDRGLAMLKELQLDASIALANDPFFGRGGRMLAANQREQELKFELVVPVCSIEQPTACLSFNYHQEHFGHTFGIHTSTGGVAETACVGFGMERVALALCKKHGCAIDRWPAEVRRKLWP